ncbi:hypothetical protein EV426DRAFT_679985 [Tirmania nivea]|nr:hypothetical protein EV426DRAFT_679985 [Tirmania nivea]
MAAPIVKLPYHVLLSRRVHYNCCHTPPYNGPVGTSASIAYIGSSSTPQTQPTVAPAEIVEHIPPCLPGEQRVSLLVHTEDSVQKHSLSDVGYEQDPDFDLVMANPRMYNDGWLTAENEESRCPCGAPRCTGKHAEILKSHQIAYQHLWVGLPEHAYQSSFNPTLLRNHLFTLGFSDPSIITSTSAPYLSMRFSRECLLGATQDGTCGLAHTSTFDFSKISSTSCTPSVHFTVSVCGSYALLSEGSIVYLYKLYDTGMDYVASVICPYRVLSVSMDTSGGRHAVAVLVDGRMAIVADIVSQNRAVVSPRRRNTYKNICSEDDPPRSVAICPQRACVAFGCQGGIELHWVDAFTGHDLSRWFPLSAPSDFLYFLPPRRGVDSVKKLRLISSAVHPEEASPLGRRFGFQAGTFVYWGAWEPGLFGAAQSDHYMAVPVDGVNVIFTDPEDGHVYVGGDAPVGGPTKLLRRIKLIPPRNPPTPPSSRAEVDIASSHAKHGCLLPRNSQESSWMRMEGDLFNEASTTIVGQKSEYTAHMIFPPRPRVYAAGQDLRYGIRIAVGYQDWLVFYTIPTELYNEGTSGAKLKYTGKFLSHLTLEKQIEIIGCHVAYVPGLIDVAVDSGPSMTVWAFDCGGEARMYRLDGTSKTGVGERERVIMERGDFVSVDGAQGETYDEVKYQVIEPTLLIGDLRDYSFKVETGAENQSGNEWESPSVSLPLSGDSTSDNYDGKAGLGSEILSEDQTGGEEWNTVTPWPLVGDHVSLASEKWSPPDEESLSSSSDPGSSEAYEAFIDGIARTIFVSPMENTGIGWSFPGLNEGILELMDQEEESFPVSPGNGTHSGASSGSSTAVSSSWKRRGNFSVTP